MVIEHLGTFNPASKCRASTDWGLSALHSYMRGACGVPAWHLRGCLHGWRGCRIRAPRQAPRLVTKL